ncbi:hypothetical protein PSTG_18944, partial [Puccinia striiformis f. sp. tritici PST-78]
MANIQILDYSRSQLVTIDSGPAKMQTGTFKIVHIIELQQYNTLIDKLEAV